MAHLSIYQCGSGAVQGVVDALAGMAGPTLHLSGLYRQDDVAVFAALADGAVALAERVTGLQGLGSGDVADSTVEIACADLPTAALVALLELVPGAIGEDGATASAEIAARGELADVQFDVRLGEVTEAMPTPPTTSHPGWSLQT